MVENRKPSRTDGILTVDGSFSEGAVSLMRNIDPPEAVARIIQARVTVDGYRLQYAAVAAAPADDNRLVVGNRIERGAALGIFIAVNMAGELQIGDQHAVFYQQLELMYVDRSVAILAPI